MSNLTKAQSDLSFLENRINEVEKYGFYPSTDFSKSDYEALKRLKKYCLFLMRTEYDGSEGFDYIKIPNLNAKIEKYDPQKAFIVY